MKEAVNVEEKFSRSTSNKKEDANFMVIHISYNKDDCMAHNNKY